MPKQDLLIGQKVKGYLVKEQLGAGGMGAVYRAEHPIIGKKVAIKFLHGQYAKSPQILARFIQEAKSINDIRHENVIDILDFDQTENGEPFLLMEYLEGKTLSTAIDKDGPLSIAKIGHIGLQICS